MRHLDLLIQTDSAFAAGAHSAMPSFRKLLRRGSTLMAPRGLCEAICLALGIQKQLDWPVAALSAQAEALTKDPLPTDTYWLRLDPLHLDIGMRGMFARSVQLSAEETSEFNQVLALLLESLLVERNLSHDLSFIAGQHGAYVQIQEPPNLRTTPIDEVDGRQPTAFLPAGADAKTWLWLLNELQIGLHSHPLNDVRVSRGQLPINGLWVWGGGVMQVISSNTEVIYSSDTHPTSWLMNTARGCGLETHTAPENLSMLIRSSGYSQAMVVIDARQIELSTLETNWFAPLLGALYWGQLGSVTLTLLNDDAQAVSLTPRQARRIWK